MDLARPTPVLEQLIPTSVSTYFWIILSRAHYFDTGASKDCKDVPFLFFLGISMFLHENFVVFHVCMYVENILIECPNSNRPWIQTSPCDHCDIEKPVARTDVADFHNFRHSNSTDPRNGINQSLSAEAFRLPPHQSKPLQSCSLVSAMWFCQCGIFGLSRVTSERPVDDRRLWTTDDAHKDSS